MVTLCMIKHSFAQLETRLMFFDTSYVKTSRYTTLLTVYDCTYRGPIISHSSRNYHYVQKRSYHSPDGHGWNSESRWSRLQLRVQMVMVATQCPDGHGSNSDSRWSWLELRLAILDFKCDFSMLSSAAYAVEHNWYLYLLTYLLTARAPKLFCATRFVKYPEKHIPGRPMIMCN